MKRYGLVGNDWDEYEDSDGDWVKYEDLVALVKRMLDPRAEKCAGDSDHIPYPDDPHPMQCMVCGSAIRAAQGTSL